MPIAATLSLARLYAPPMVRPVQFKGPRDVTQLFAIQCYRSAARLAGVDERRGSLIDRNA